MSGHSYTVEFRFIGESLDIEQISREMDLEPSVSRSPNVSPTGRKRDGVWGYNGHDQGRFLDEWSSLEEGLVFLFGSLDSKIGTIRKLAKNYEGIWWCGHFQSSFDGGPFFGLDTINGLHKFGMPIFIDNYFSTESDK